MGTIDILCPVCCPDGCIEGHVYDKLGVGVNGATVQAVWTVGPLNYPAAGPVVTNAAGYYVISPVPRGAFTVSVTSATPNPPSHWEPDPCSTTVVAHIPTCVTCDFHEIPDVTTGCIDGHVYDCWGDPAVGYEVNATKGGVTVSDVTDKFGYYCIDALAFGSYEMSITEITPNGGAWQFDLQPTAVVAIGSCATTGCVHDDANEVAVGDCYDCETRPCHAVDPITIYIDALGMCPDCSVLGAGNWDVPWFADCDWWGTWEIDGNFISIRFWCDENQWKFRVEINMTQCIIDSTFAESYGMNRVFCSASGVSSCGWAESVAGHDHWMMMCGYAMVVLGGL